MRTIRQAVLEVLDDLASSLRDIREEVAEFVDDSAEDDSVVAHFAYVLAIQLHLLAYVIAHLVTAVVSAYHGARLVIRRSAAYVLLATLIGATLAVMVLRRWL